MHPASEHHIPDGLLAAIVLLSEKPRHGVASKNPAPNQGINEANSTAAIGLRAGLLLNRVQSRYTGKERDTESGLDYFGARYYASSMGRWMSPDWSARAEPVPYAKLNNPQSLNLYGYVWNNPLSNVDLNGHEESGSGLSDLFKNYHGRYIIAPQERPKTNDSITVNGGSHWWSRLGHWFGGTSLAIGFGRFGRMGGPAHRSAVSRVANMLRDEGYAVTQEKYVKTPNGAKSGRFIDVYAEKETANGIDIREFQICRNNLNGTPVSREVSALNDIQASPDNFGIRPDFIPYNSPLVTGNFAVPVPVDEVPIPIREEGPIEIP